MINMSPENLTEDINNPPWHASASRQDAASLPATVSVIPHVSHYQRNSANRQILTFVFCVQTLCCSNSTFSLYACCTATEARTHAQCKYFFIYFHCYRSPNSFTPLYQQGEPLCYTSYHLSLSLAPDEKVELLMTSPISSRQKLKLFMVHM